MFHIYKAIRDYIKKRLWDYLLNILGFVYIFNQQDFSYIHRIFFFFSKSMQRARRFITNTIPKCWFLYWWILLTEKQWINELDISFYGKYHNDRNKE